MINLQQALKLFNDHLDMWKEWSYVKGKIRWVDKNGKKHVASDTKDLAKWFKSHTHQN